MTKKDHQGQMDELWRRITALDKQYEVLEARWKGIVSAQGEASPEAEQAARRLGELGAELRRLYEERADILKGTRE